MLYRKMRVIKKSRIADLKFRNTLHWIMWLAKMESTYKHRIQKFYKSLNKKPPKEIVRYKL